MNTKIAFQLLKFLQENSCVSIKQEYSFNNELLDSKLLLRHVDSTLIGIDYTLKVNDRISQELLIFATPLQHLLQCGVLFPPNSKIIRIEYDKKEKLIFSTHLHFLQRPHTVLEEIEIEYLEGFEVTSQIKSVFNLFLPYQEISKLNEIIISKLANSVSILCTPHINPNHLTYIEQMDLALFDIFRCKEYNESVHKYFNFSLNHISKEFLEVPVIDSVFISYPMYYNYSQDSVYNLQNLAKLEIDTQIHLTLHTNSTIPIISSKISKYPLPIFINSKNEYVTINDETHFLNITGINFSYNIETIKSLLVKDKFSQNSLYCNLYLLEEAGEILSKLTFEEKYSKDSTIKLKYSNAKEYYIKNALIPNNTTKLFIDEINNNCGGNNFKESLEISLELFSNIIILFKQLCIHYASYPKSELQSSISKSIIHLTLKLVNILENESDLEIIFEEITLCIFEFEKIITKFEIKDTELFELSLFIETIFKLILNFEQRIKDIISKKELIDTIKAECRTIRELCNNSKFISNEFLSQSYDLDECRELFTALYQIIVSLPILSKQISYFSTNIDEFKIILNPISHQISIDEIEEKVNHSIILVKNKYITLLYY